MTRVVNPELYLCRWFYNKSYFAKYLYMWLYPQANIAGYCPFDEVKAKLYIGIDEESYQRALLELNERLFVSENRQYVLFKDYHVEQGFSRLNYKRSQVKGIINNHLRYAGFFKNERKYFESIPVYYLEVEEQNFGTLAEYLDFMGCL